MSAMREQELVGLDYLEAATSLLQRTRRAHPTRGLYDAAELQWWWSIPRSTDSFPQVFWFDDLGRPEAAVILTDFSDGSSAVYEETTLALVFMPSATPKWVAHVVERGLAHAKERGISAVELEVDRTDELLRDLLIEHGFEITEENTMVEAWLDADDRPEISPLHADYRLSSRQDVGGRAHHMADPRRPEVEQRLLETSLYRPGLDLLILGSDENHVAYGLFWYDPETATGVVEPIRTEDGHQRRGFARHILTMGIDLLAEAGAKRIKICFEPDNPAASHLYLSVGFEPVKRTDVFSGGTASRAGLSDR